MSIISTTWCINPIEQPYPISSHEFTRDSSNSLKRRKKQDHITIGTGFRMKQVTPYKCQVGPLFQLGGYACQSLCMHFILYNFPGSAHWGFVRNSSHRILLRSAIFRVPTELDKKTKHKILSRRNSNVDNMQDGRWCTYKHLPLVHTPDYGRHKQRYRHCKDGAG